MGKTIEQTGNDYNNELREVFAEQEQIKSAVNQIQDDLDELDSGFIYRLSEVNTELADYTNKDFIDFLDELSLIFTDYAEVFAELDQKIKGGL